MILFFGPAGAGKSMQGQLLSARFGWRWLSSGQLLRDSHDPAIIEKMQTGQLIDSDTVHTLMIDALKRAKDIDRVILDGYPRKLEQAQHLIDAQPEHGRSIQLAIVLEVPRHEISRRMMLRGRSDDTEEAIQERLSIYRQEIYPILNFLTQQHVHVAHIDGNGTVGQVHDRIVEELQACSLV